MFYELRRKLALLIAPSEMRAELEEAARNRYFVDTALSLKNWCMGDVEIVPEIIGWIDEKTRINFMTNEEYQARLKLNRSYMAPPPIHDFKIELRKYIKVGTYDETF